MRAGLYILRALRSELPTTYRNQLKIEAVEDEVAREFIAGVSIEAQARGACLRESSVVDPARYQEFLTYGREIVARKRLVRDEDGTSNKKG